MQRADFIKLLGLSAMSTVTNLKSWASEMRHFSPAEKMPALFIGHGNPMNVLYDNDFTKALSKIRSEIPKPSAILVVSAHWETKGTFVHTAATPKIIYDFYGFPEEMYKIQYPCKGSPEYAAQVKESVKKTTVQKDLSWGLDHGAWTILKHIYPEADIPVFQVSLDHSISPQKHYEIAEELKALRKKGVLIIGSGNIVHNLGMIDFSSANLKFDWAIEFDEKVKKFLNNRDHASLINYKNISGSKYAVPTNEHYLPLLYSIGLQEKNEEVSHIYESVEHGSISMRCVKIG
jgi:4,5-DOPA dioxygenase extradiol